jgi:hypothetical protein
MTIAIPRLDRTTAAERGLTLADFLVPISVGERLNPRLRHVVLIATGALFIYLTALVYIVRTPVPLTGQTFGVLLVGGALGARRGFAAVALYVLLGLVGLPFFAEGKGGSAVILGATGGYLIGFIVAGAVVGRLADQRGNGVRPGVLFPTELEPRRRQDDRRIRAGNHLMPRWLRLQVSRTPTASPVPGPQT